MNIIGISCFKSDSSACLIRDGQILASAQEERFTRKKHDASFPLNAAKWCLGFGGIKDIDFIAFSNNTLIYKLKALFYLKVFGVSAKGVFFSSKESFCAAAFYPSNLENSAILINNTANPGIVFAKADINGIALLNKKFSYSLGAVYSAYTKHLGFKANSDEYKVMGLAAFGKPAYKDRIISFSSKIFKLGVKKKLTGEELTQEHKDLAASVQAAVEEETLKLTAELHKLTNSENLCLTGGVALNCLVNSRILKQGLFKNLWIQPAATSAGTCLGAALLVWHKVLKHERKVSGGQDLMQGCFLGPEFDAAYIENLLIKLNIKYQKLEFGAIAKTGAELLAQGSVVGWFQGRMEFGPRALGARSILADSRNPGIHDRLNLKVKIRENFRPFAPTVLAEKVEEYFDLERGSPYMLLTACVKEGKRKDIAAVTHADNSSRVQTLKREDNPLYYDLVNEFFKKTGCPVIINTSFNTKNEPIVRTPEEALRCFSETDMDYLIMGRFVIDKRSLK